MWCRSAVSFSSWPLVTAPRMRSCASDTASRLCVRTVLCSFAFLLVPLLPSTSSAAGCPALFAGFAGTISESDFFAPFIIGDGLRPSRCGPGAASQGDDKEIPVPAQEVYVHAEGLKTTRGAKVLAMADPRLLPSACHDGIGTPDCIAFAAQYLAYTRPCQRFADGLAAVSRA